MTSNVAVRLLASAAATVVGACSSNGSTATSLPAGQWGGTGLLVETSASAARMTFACSVAGFSGNITTDDNGGFVIIGSDTLRTTLGKDTIPGLPQVLQVRIVGKVVADLMSVDVSFPSLPVIPLMHFDLKHNQVPDFSKATCPFSF
jgi:hypothetical protein